MNDNPTISELFESLGYGKPGTDIDTAVRWVLTEASLRRDLEKPLECGDRVRVVGFADAESEEAHYDLLGSFGKVMEIRGDGMGMGETPEDPVYVVRVTFNEASGSYLKTSFFREEIERA